MSENSFLRSFSALLASAILVCGTHLLLIASSNYGPPRNDPAALLTPPAPAAEPAASEAIDVEVTAMPERSPSAETEPQTSEPVATAEAETSSSAEQPVASAPSSYACR